MRPLQRIDFPKLGVQLVYMLETGLPFGMKELSFHRKGIGKSDTELVQHSGKHTGAVMLWGSTNAAKDAISTPEKIEALRVKTETVANGILDDFREEVGRSNDFPDDDGSDIGPVEVLTLDDEIEQALTFNWNVQKDADGVAEQVTVT